MTLVLPRYRTFAFLSPVLVTFLQAIYTQILHAFYIVLVTMHIHVGNKQISVPITASVT